MEVSSGHGPGQVQAAKEKALAQRGDGACDRLTSSAAAVHGWDGRVNPRAGVRLTRDEGPKGVRLKSAGYRTCGTV